MLKGVIKVKRILPYPEINPQKIVINPEIEIISDDEVNQVVRPEMPIIQPQKKPL